MSNVTEILNISFDNDTGNYSVRIPQGSNLNEVFFGINVLIKCLVRDGVVENEKSVHDLLHKYATDPQYQELKSEDKTNENDVVQ